MSDVKMSRGLEKYYEFHQLEPKRVDKSSASIPADAELAGPAIWVTYRSGKWGKGTYDYIHHFKDGVRIAVCQREGGRRAKIPKKIQAYETLVLLGKCLGFAYQDEDGEEVEAKFSPTPELYCSHDGKCLFVIEKKRRILAIIWGGKLDVEARGIVN